MRRASVLGLVGTLLAAGCGGSDDEPPAVDAGPTDTGPAPANVAINPPTHTFQPTVVGQTSVEQVFTVQNSGGSALAAGAVVVSGSVGDFAISSNTCNATVAAGGSCTVGVKFAPKSAGAKTLTIRATADGKDVTATISGTGLQGAILSATPRTISLPATTIGQTSAAVSVTVQNVGDQASSEIGATLAGANAAEFVVADGCGTLAPNATCKIDVTFKPTGMAGGARTAALTISATSGGSEMVAISGNANTAALLAAMPTTKDFADTVVGADSAAASFMIQNSGGTAIGPLSAPVLSNPTDFKIDSASNCANATLQPGVSCTLVVVFNPKSAGIKQATATINGPVANTGVSVTLNGKGISPSALTADQAEVNFGSVGVNSESAPVTVTFTNGGGAPTPLLETVIAGASQLQRVSTTCNKILNPTETCTVVVKYVPTAPNSDTATLTVRGGLLAANVALRGQGVTTGLQVSAAAGSTFSFGSSPVTVKSATQNTYVVKNIGTSAANMLMVSFTGTAAGDYAIEPMGTTCGASLTPGQECNVVASFTPTAAGARAALLRVVAAGTVTDSAVTGTGLALISFAPDTTFSDTTTGTVGNEVVFTVTVRKATTLSTDVTGLGSNFAIALGNNECAGAMLAAGDTCDITVRFNPTGMSGPKTGSIVVSGTNGIPNLTIPLEGLATGPLSFGAAAFGDRAVGSATNLSVTLTNNGPLAIRPNVAPTVMGDADFAFVSTTCLGAELAPSGAGTCAVVVRFTPSTPGAKTATLSIGGGGETATKTVTGTGTVATTITSTPAMQAYADTIVGNQTDLVTFTVKNNASVQNVAATYAGIAVSITGAGNGSYEKVSTGTGDCAGATLAPQATCTVAVRFKPPINTAAGNKAANLVINATPPGGGGAIDVLTVALSGTALEALVVTPARNSTTDQGDVVANNAAADQPTKTTVTVLNRSASPVLFTRTWNVGTEFAIVAGMTDTCAALTVANTLPAGAMCTLQVAANSPGAGTTAASNLTIAAAGGVVSSHQLNFTANGLTDASIGFTRYAGNESLDFGTVTLGATTITIPPFEFTVRNNGQTPTGPLTFSLVGGDAAQFTVGGTCATGSTVLAANQTCTIIVGFAPTTAGAKSVTFKVSESSGTAGSSTNGGVGITLAGTAVAAGADVVSPTRVDFGGGAAGSAPITRTFQITNANAAALVPGAPGAALSFATGADFAADVGMSTCGTSILSLATGESCVYAVTFTPQGGTGWKTDTVTVDLPGGRTDLDVALIGRVLNPVSLGFGPDLAFGNVLSGTTSSKTITLTNSGEVATSGVVAVTKGGADPTQFAVSGCGAVLGAGESCVATVVFQPTSAGAKTATLGVTVGGIVIGGITANLGGTGGDPAGLVTTPVTGSTIVIGDPTPIAVTATSGAETITISNPAGANRQTTGPVVITVPADANFIWDVSGCAAAASSGLAAGGSCNITVRFNPQSLPAGGEIGTTAMISATPGASSMLTITGKVGAAFSASGNLTFPAAIVGQASSDQTVTITNNGGVAATGFTFSFSGTNSADFSVAGGTCTSAGASVAPTASCTVIVRGVPGGTGMRTGTLRVSAGGLGQTVSVGLTATGT